MMNYYAFIPLVALLINCFCWAYIYAQHLKSPVNRAYLIYAGFTAAWILSGFIIWSSTDNNRLILMFKLSSIAWLPMGFLFLNFTYTFLKRQRDAAYYASLSSSFIAVLVSLATSLIINGHVRHAWGPAFTRGPLYVPFFFVAVIVPFFYALFLIYRDSARATDGNMRQQLMSLLQGTSASLFLGLMTDFVLPDIFRSNVFPRAASSGSVIQTMFIFHAVIRHNFLAGLTFDAKEVANDLFMNVQDGIILADKAGTIIQINKAAEELFDIHAAEIADLKISSLLSNYNFNQSYQDYETEIRSRARKRVVSISQSTVHRAHLELGKIIMLRDITEHKRVEDAMAGEKERLAVTLRSIGEGGITTDIEGKVILLNKVAEALTGWTQEEAAGKPLAEVYPIIHEKTRVPCPDPVAVVLRTGGMTELATHTALIARDGRERSIADTGAPIHDKNSQPIGVVLVFRDVTEKQAMAAEILRMEKLKSLGVLAGGIAHDFNNMLMVIMGNIAMAQVSAHSPQEMGRVLAEAEKACVRARDLTQQLLTFAKGGAPILQTASIGELLQDSFRFALRGSHVQCEFDIPADLWAVEMDEGQMSQAMHNLAINAQQAMRNGGTVRVRAGNITVRAPEGLPLAPGNYVKIAVADQGVGIPSQDLPRIFDPYFTTKQEGSGLGLTSAYSIIKTHAGHITVESEPGEGTTFYIYLPASMTEMPVPSKAEAPQATGRGKILVMDDEESIRQVVSGLLQSLGYAAEFASDGAAAVAMYQKALATEQPFTAVIMDLTIPGAMGGKEAIERLLAIDSSVKAVVSSGYSNDPVMADPRKYGFRGVIAKPYKREELQRLLHSLMAETNG